MESDEIKATVKNNTDAQMQTEAVQKTISDGKTPEVVKKDQDRDNYMTAEESVAYGLVDRILSHKPATK